MSRTLIFKVSEMSEKDILQAARALTAGAVAVVPTDTVYGIGTGALCEDSIQRIYTLKNRPASNPLQILTGSLEQARRMAEFSGGALRLAQKFWPGGLTMILSPSPEGRMLARGFTGIGLRVPNCTFLSALLYAMPLPLACTSANLHGQPVLTEETDVLETFDGKADYIFLDGILNPVASSVVDLTGEPVLLREGDISRAELERVWGGPFYVK